jgi:hypothetical protein
MRITSTGWLVDEEMDIIIQLQLYTPPLPLLPPQPLQQQRLNVPRLNEKKLTVTEVHIFIHPLIKDNIFSLLLPMN